MTVPQSSNATPCSIVSAQKDGTWRVLSRNRQLGAIRGGQVLQLQKCSFLDVRRNSTEKAGDSSLASEKRFATTVYIILERTDRPT